jgi:hypothetical protein
LDVLRVGDHGYAARSLERLKTADGSFEFHPVVRSFVLETGQFPLVLSKAKHACPAAGAGIAAAGAVDHDGYFLF